MCQGTRKGNLELGLLACTMLPCIQQHSLLPLDLQEELFIKFAEFEEKVGEPERARAIYKYARDHLPRSQATNVYRRFVTFEKQHGDREGIEVLPSSRITPTHLPSFPLPLQILSCTLVRERTLQPCASSHDK